MTKLNARDNIGMTFSIIMIAMIVFTGFLLVERTSVSDKWKLPVAISAMVTGIAAIHYFYMRKLWLSNKSSPVVYRYLDWFLTVPLQLSEFYLVLSVDGPAPKDFLAKLLIASFLMILFGFLGETGRVSRPVGFVCGMVAWVYILYEVFLGGGAKLKNDSSNPSIKLAYNAMKWIVTIGWSIYPLGYILKEKDMNLVYNLGDFVNKILFGGMILYAAKKDTKVSES